MAKTKAPVKGKKKTAVEKIKEKQEANAGSSRAQIIDRIIAHAEKEGGKGCVQRAADTASSYLLRRPTGIISIDIALAGGFPAAAPSVIVGPDGAGKDYMLWLTAAEQQRIYGDDFCTAIYFTEFKPDKLYMKNMCGFQVAFSETEIEEMSLARYSAGKSDLTAEELDYYRHQIGDVQFIYGVSAEKGFDTLFEFLDANICQFIAVNSLGYLQTEAKEGTDSFEDFAQRSSEAVLLGKVLPKFSMYLNRGASGGHPNETALLLLNQVRANDQMPRAMPGRPPQDRDKYRAAVAAWALKHGKAIELMIHNGSRIWDGPKGEAKAALGRNKQWELTKGKLGTHEGKKGEFQYFWDTGADRIGDLITTAMALGVLTLKGSWVVLQEGNKEYDFQSQSFAKAHSHLKKSPELIEWIKGRCYQEAGILYRHK